MEIQKMTSRTRRTSGRKFKPVKRLPRKRQTEETDELSSKKRVQPKLTPNSKLYFTKLGIGALIGSFSGILNLNPLLGWTLAIFGILIAVFIVRYIYDITEEQLTQKKVFLSGTFSLVLVTIVTWSLAWMFFIPNLPSPR